MEQSQNTELLGLSLQELTDLVETLGEAPYRARQLFDGLYRQRWSSLEQFTTLPLGLRQKLNDLGYTPSLPRVEKSFASTDGTVRYLLGFSDGQSVETVWMPEGDGGEAGDGSTSGDEELADRRDWHRATICISSQVGCAVDCAFCMTALLGLKRNLTTGEIVGQVLAVLADQQADIARDRVNLVFMGQGEPFLNYDNFMQAVRLLVEGVGIPESRMTVSTSGILPRIADFGAEPVRPKLAVSLNAPSEELRTQIMPITKKWTIEKLMAALREFPLRNRERLTFEYVLLGGVNDEIQHARQVVDLLRGLRAKVNLIALNPGPEIPFSMPSDERVLGRSVYLTRRGVAFRPSPRLPRGWSFRPFPGPCGPARPRRSSWLRPDRRWRSRPAPRPE